MTKPPHTASEGAPTEGYLSLENLMTCLMEETAEVAKVMSKAKRFGVEDSPPGKPLTNRQLMAWEIGDLLGVIKIIQREYCDQMRKLTADVSAAKEAKIKENYGRRFRQ